MTTKQLNPRRIIHILLLLCATTLVFLFILTRIDFHNVIAVLLQARPAPLLLALLIMTVGLLTTALRWHVILRAMGSRLSFATTIRIIMAVFPVAAITPSKSGDVMRAYYLRHHLPASQTIGSILLENILDVGILILLAATGMILQSKGTYAGLLVVGLLAVFLAACILHRGVTLPIRRSWQEKVNNLSVPLQALRRKPRLLIVVVLLSAWSWFFTILQTMAFFAAVGADLSLPAALGLVPLAIFTGMLPITLGGMGTRDAAFVFFFAGIASGAQLLGVGILFSAFRYWLVALVGLGFLWTMKPVAHSHDH